MRLIARTTKVYNSMELIKFPPLAIQRTASIIAFSDASSALYLKGPELVKMFNELGFSDSYTFVEGRGIQTPDFGEGLSRINYTIKRLEDLNKAFRLPEACYKFSEIVKTQEEAISSLQKVLEPFHINLFSDLSKKVVEPVKVAKTGEPETHILIPPTESNSILVSVIETQESAERKKLEDSILGEIPEDRKVVFISYSWDNETHKEWVGKLADDLTARGIYVLYDGYNEDGTPIDLFMELGIQRADKVIVIGTPNFMLKYNSPATGASFEGYIIRAYIVQSIGTKKIIPCLRLGDFSHSFPMILGSRKGHNLSDDKRYDEELDDLCREIWDRPKRIRPALGAIPSYVSEK